MAPAHLATFHRPIAAVAAADGQEVPKEFAPLRQIWRSGRNWKTKDS